MSVAPSPTIVGVFRDRQAVEQAIEALYRVGFQQDQIRYSVPGSSGSFLNDLKSLFTGTTTDSGDLINKLTSMGLSEEEARYYSNEYENGNIVLAVNAFNHEQEALTIFHQYGGYGIYNTQQTANAYNQQANDYAQPTTNDYAQQPASSTWDEETTEHPALNDSTYDNQDNVAAPENTANDHEFASHDTAPTDQTASDNYETDPLDTTDQTNPEHSTDHATTSDYQTDQDTTSEHDQATEDYQNEEQPAIEDVPTQTFAYDSRADSYHAHDNVSAAEDSQVDNTTHANQADSTASEYAPVDQTTTDTTTPDETNTDHHITPAEEAPAIAADTKTPEATSAHQDTLVDTPASTETTPTDRNDFMDNATANETAPADQTAPVSSTDQDTPLDNQSNSTPTTPTLQAEKLRLLQQRLESAQQRLQESKAQLQAAKEHETQLQAVKQQLEAIEAELQKNDAELQETHSRIEQYY